MPNNNGVNFFDFGRRGGTCAEVAPLLRDARQQVGSDVAGNSESQSVCSVAVCCGCYWVLQVVQDGSDFAGDCVCVCMCACVCIHTYFITMFIFVMADACIYDPRRYMIYKHK